jgi:hypothetical protein
MVTIKFHVQVETQGAVVVGSSAVLGHGFSFLTPLLVMGDNEKCRQCAHARNESKQLQK